MRRSSVVGSVKAGILFLCRALRRPALIKNERSSCSCLWTMAFSGPEKLDYGELETQDDALMTQKMSISS